MPVEWKEVHLPLAQGLNTKPDPRVMEGGLAACKNAAFTELGGLQKRLPITAVTGGSLSNIRKLAIYNDELIAFTSTEIYSWSPALAAWVSRGAYLAPKVTERSVFTRTTEQTICDRAELSNVIVYSWLDATNSSTTVYVAALDKTSGAVLLAPTSMGANTNRPRLVALSTRILLFCQTGANALGVKAIDVTSAATLASSAAAGFTSVEATEFNGSYDVTALSTTAAIAVWLRVTTTSYGYASVTATPTVTASTKARACDGHIAVAVTADGTKVAVLRENGTDILGDILTSALVDSTTGAAVGSSASPAQISCAFRSVADSGEFRCYTFWADSPVTTDSSSYDLNYNYVDTAGNVGTAGVLARRIAPGSRAFDHNGRVYFWGVFAADTSSTPALQAQNTYFLLRDDGVPICKAAPTAAGGLLTTTGWLPGVQSLGSNRYAFCGVERRVIELGPAGLGYADRGPRDIVLEFDSNEARRSVQLGKTLYITGGQVSQFDGQGVAELGFHLYPHYLAVVEANEASGNIAAGNYSWKVTYRWDNAQGETERSTTATIISADIAGASGDEAELDIGSLPLTTKASSSHGAPACEVWRTVVNPTSDSPFYLVTSKNPTDASSADNGYLEEVGSGQTDHSNFRDNLSDATLITKEANPEDGGVLESLSPPPATIIAASQDRIFLAGISYDPYLIWYSKTRSDGELASFHEALTIQLPTVGGAITALAFLNDTLIAFCESAIYALPGQGFDNLGGGFNFTAQLLATDIGATSADLVAVIPPGLLFFSSKGWYLLSRDQSLSYVGAPVEDYNSDTFIAVHVLERQHQIRCLSSSRLLVWDYLANQWSEWEEASRVSAAHWSGEYYLASSSALLKEQTTHSTNVTYSLVAETGWLKFAGLQGYKRVKRIAILGEYRSAHRLKVEFYRDYDSATAFQTETWTVSPTTVGGPLQVEIDLSIQKMQSLKIRITDIATGSSSPPTGEALKLTGLSLRIGFKPGLMRLPAAQTE